MVRSGPEAQQKQFVQAAAIRLVVVGYAAEVADERSLLELQLTSERCPSELESAGLGSWGAEPLERGPLELGQLQLGGLGCELEATTPV
jgi:hypothetical protein